MPDTAEIIGELISQLPPEARADTKAHQIVAAAVAAGVAAASQPAPSPIRIQRVDEYVSAGVYTSSFEVVDARKPKGERIVKNFPAGGRVTIDEAYASAREEAIKRAPIGGGAYLLAAVDSDEYFHDTDYEVLAAQHLYGTISGCALTYDAADLTVDLAAGAILFNGFYTAVAVAANAYTLVADGSNERWAALTIGSAGTAVLVSGDPAASSSTEPTKPEIGDRVLVGMAKIQAAQTIAANCEYKLDKRILAHAPWTEVWKLTTEVGPQNDTLQSDDELFFTVTANRDYLVEVFCRIATGTTPDWKYAWTLAGMTWDSAFTGTIAGNNGADAVRSDQAVASGTGIAVTASAALTAGIFRGFFVIHAGVTGGTLNFQWAQNTTDASATNVLKGSYLRYRDIGAT